MKKILKFLRVLLFATVLAVGLSFWLLLSPAGMEVLTPWLAARLSALTGMEARIEKLRWVYPLGIRFEGLVFDEDERSVLRVVNGSVRISPQDLFSGKVRVHYVGADSVVFSGRDAGDVNLPEAGETEGAGEPPPDLKAFFDRLTVEALSFPEIRLVSPGAGEETVLALEGSLVNGALRGVAESKPFAVRRLTGFSDLDAGAMGSARLEVSGTLLEPEGRLSVALTGLMPADSELWDGVPAMLQFEAELRGGRGTVALRIEELPGDPVVMRLDVPVRLALVPFALSFPETEPISGALHSSTDLAGLSNLFVLDVIHRLRGHLEVDLRLEGSFDAPRLQGGVRVVDGSYEHALTGFHLRDLALALSARKGALRIDSFEARDGQDGRLRLDGEVILERGRALVFDTAVTFQSFRAVRQDELDAVVDGTLRWTGGRKTSVLEGQLALRPVEIRIPEKLPHTVRTIEVVERFGEDEREASSEEARREGRHQMTLNLRLDSPDRVFVRGRGLDSEWSARLRLRGPVREPILTGELSILRGRFLFFGKRLVITRGRVLFDGAFPPTPGLEVLAELRSGGILGVLQVSGTAKNPEITLDSIPPLPEDEILARLLFGRESTRITPWQALTLARALNSLRGGGSAFDLMGTTRRMLQVDQIEIRGDETGEGTTRVAVGRHVGDRVYVELERGMDAESGRARIEVELTPTLRLETQSGVDADAGIGLRWRWDY